MHFYTQVPIFTILSSLTPLLYSLNIFQIIFSIFLSSLEFEALWTLIWMLAISQIFIFYNIHSIAWIRASVSNHEYYFMVFNLKSESKQCSILIKLNWYLIDKTSKLATRTFNPHINIWFTIFVYSSSAMSLTCAWNILMRIIYFMKSWHSIKAKIYCTIKFFRILEHFITTCTSK